MQDLSQTRWDDVRFFLAAFRHKSLGAAAARLGVDTSTMSRRLTAFEETVGQRLFERSREGLLATRAAEVVVAAAEAMEAAHARLARDASDVEAAAEGVVRLTADPGMAEVFVAPALARLRAAHPKIDIELEASPRALDLTRHEADIAVRTAEPRGAELVTTRIGTGRWLPAAAPAVGKALGRVGSWDALAWITWDRDFASYAPSRWLAKHAPAARIALRTSSFSSQLAAVAAGLGVGLFPEPFMRERGLVAVRAAPELGPSIGACPEVSVWVVGHRALRDVPRVAAVWEFLTKDLRRALGPRPSSG